MSVASAFLMKKLKSKVATGVFELIGCAKVDAVFCEGVLVMGADAGESGVSCAGSGTLGCCCCCFFAVVRFFVDDGILRETSDFKNSWGRSKAQGDAIRSDSGLGLDLERLGM